MVAIAGVQFVGFSIYKGIVNNLLVEEDQGAGKICAHFCGFFVIAPGFFVIPQLCLWIVMASNKV